MGTVRMKASLLLVLVLGVTLQSLLAETDVAELVERAQREIITERLAAGSSPVRRKRKATPFSRMMTLRNGVVRRAFDQLSQAEPGLDSGDRIALIKRELRRGGGGGSKGKGNGGKGHQGHHGSGGGGGGGKRPGGFGDNIVPIRPDFEDACLNAVPVCQEGTQYRNVTGTCNNINNPFWGSANIGMRRYLAAEYSDNSSSPFTGSTTTYSRQATSLPLARLVSLAFHPDEDLPSQQVSHMVTQWGQFLDHDITLTPENEVHDCCQEPEQPECFPLTLPSDDPFYSSLSTAQTCLEFTRSTAFCEEPDTTREQMNAITAFVDASNVYGSDEETSALLRSFTGGKLLVAAGSEKELLPEIDGLMQAGDVRALEMPGLASVHTLWLREHNRLAAQISTANPGLGDENIFQMARRILIAEMQNIVYDEYLPVVLGEDTMSHYEIGLSSDHSKQTKYDDQIDPSITNSFATAAYRFGHSMIQGLIKMLSTSTYGQEKEFQLRDHYFNMENYLLNSGEGMEQLLAGLINQPAQDMDRFVTEEATNFLFPEQGNNFGSDLVARNIQRGRDHGLPGYNKWREECGLKEIKSMSSRPKEISSSNWALLQSLYSSPDDIDLFVAGLAEEKVTGGLTGKTFNCIKARQFSALKTGDRFFFTHKRQAGSFSSTQLKEIRGRRLRDVICDNTDITSTRENVFLLTGDFKDCSSANALDITKFL